MMRAARLMPSLVVISSDPASKDELPDLGSTAVFAKFDHEDGQMAVITQDSGTIHLRVDGAANRTLVRYDDPQGRDVVLTPIELDEGGNPIDWVRLLKDRVTGL